MNMELLLLISQACPICNRLPVLTRKLSKPLVKSPSKGKGYTIKNQLEKIQKI